jgi:hypothetical protein
MRTKGRRIWERCDEDDVNNNKQDEDQVAVKETDDNKLVAHNKCTDDKPEDNQAVDNKADDDETADNEELADDEVPADDEAADHKAVDHVNSLYCTELNGGDDGVACWQVSFKFKDDWVVSPSLEPKNSSTVHCELPCFVKSFFFLIYCSNCLLKIYIVQNWTAETMVSPVGKYLVNLRTTG